MTRGKLFLVLLANTVAALAPNFLSDLISPWVDPGNDVFVRTYLVIAILILWLPVLLWTMNQDKTEGNPEHSRMDGWFETISAVALVFSASTLFCWRMDSTQSDQLPEILWLVPVGIAAGTFIVEWPTERKKRYEDLSRWIWSELLTKDSIGIQEIIRHFVHIPETIIATPTSETAKNEKEKEYKYFIQYFYMNNQEHITIYDDQLVLRPHYRTKDSPEKRGQG